MINDHDHEISKSLEKKYLLRIPFQFPQTPGANSIHWIIVVVKKLKAEEGQARFSVYGQGGDGIGPHDIWLIIFSGFLCDENNRTSNPCRLKERYSSCSKV